jgi:hypothetical protein
VLFSHRHSPPKKLSLPSPRCQFAPVADVATRPSSLLGIGGEGGNGSIISLEVLDLISCVVWMTDIVWTFGRFLSLIHLAAVFERLAELSKVNRAWCPVVPHSKHNPSFLAFSMLTLAPFILMSPSRSVFQVCFFSKNLTLGFGCLVLEYPISPGLRSGLACCSCQQCRGSSAAATTRRRCFGCYIKQILI